ncbi:Putative heterokaryon incompatibility [Septoria linicola]|uniref:Heterokaryon incompatibility n=1 Tax=Septoria linicola TaxID=215465 RepID=A0A9Q9AZ34_9PEZI|nr:putative heterokaryon incompatibility [Septoria linicola]USW55165.1 Putative heterokaryon incompatibility [Septoria linicola]
MWLIDTKQLILHYVNNSKDAKYAILSHVWQTDNEVTFQEFRNRDARHKTGYAKIFNTCKMALSHGHNYAWMDTCCINKKSSAELSQAINSMWGWYCDAEVCYAYLGDVHDDIRPSDDDRTDESSLSWHVNTTTESAPSGGPLEVFCRSEWFTRGWTLQAIIAPRDVQFYNAAWSYIGRQAEMLHQLSKATGIDVSALEDRHNVPCFVAARKLSWASKRYTTRIEDQAYSLLGLMGVSMPLLYGEGSRAFLRLQEEILRNTEDQSIFAWEFQEPIKHSHLPCSLFASEPLQFKQCSKVVAWDGLHNGEHRLTNRGVTFDELYFDQDAQLALLNCRYEDDFRGPIALRIEEWHQSNGTWLVKRHGGRTTVPDWLHPQILQLTLRRFTSPAVRHSSKLLKLQICPHGMNTEAFAIYNAWPRSLWNNGTQVMSRGMPTSEKNATFTTCLELRTNGTGKHFWLRIRLVGDGGKYQFHTVN